MSSDCENKYVCSTRCLEYSRHTYTVSMVPFVAKTSTGGCRPGSVCKLFNDEYNCVPGTYPYNKYLTW